MNQISISLEEFSKEQLLDIAMILEDIKVGLSANAENFSSVSINPFGVNNYFFANKDNFYFDEFEGHENYSNYSLRAKRLKLLEYLQKNGVIKTIKLHKKPEEDPEVLGKFTDEIYEFEVAVNKNPFNFCYKQFTAAAQPFVDKFFKERFGDENATESPEQETVELSFGVLGAPIVAVGSKTYKLSTMREGNAYKIVKFCLDNSPNKAVSLDELKANLALEGVSNIKNALHNSLFDVNTGLLRAFVSVESKVIVVKKSVLLDSTQLQAIIKSSNISE